MGHPNTPNPDDGSTDSDINAAAQQLFRLCGLIRFLDTDSIHEPLIAEGFDYATVLRSVANGDQAPTEELFDGATLQTWTANAEAAIAAMEDRLTDATDRIWLGMFDPTPVSETAADDDDTPTIEVAAPDNGDEVIDDDDTPIAGDTETDTTRDTPNEEEDEPTEGSSSEARAVIPPPPPANPTEALIATGVIPPPPGAPAPTPVSVFADPDHGTVLTATTDDEGTEDTVLDLEPEPVPAPVEFDPFNEHTPKHKKRKKVRIWGSKNPR